MLNDFLEEMFCIASIAMFTLTLDDQRKRVLPLHFEQQVFLFAKERSWNIKNVDSVVVKIV